MGRVAVITRRQDDSLARNKAVQLAFRSYCVHAGHARPRFVKALSRSVETDIDAKPRQLLAEPAHEALELAPPRRARGQEYLSAKLVLRLKEHDFVAPPSGTHTLKEFYEEMATTL